MSFLNHDPRALHPLLVLNFKKFSEAKSNSKFDEINHIKFLT